MKDLCGRLPYGVKISVNDNVETLQGINILDTVVEYDSCLSSDIEEVKPYLFPPESMTEEQMEELCILCDWHDGKNDAKSILVLYQEQFVMNADVIDWLNKNHFDYRGLIPMGLAIDATGLNIY